jgi:MoxR-like ATPase
MMELQSLINNLSSRFMERDDEIKGIVLSLMTREHCLFIGPPGTAKSALVEAAAAMSGLSYFRALVTKFTTPDELFGPPDIRELEKGIYKRNSSGMLPEAKVIFLDEVFKASPSILNTLLSIMQERVFRNGAMHKVPLISLFGASNEVPEGEDDAALSAFNDRFLLRYQVKPISDPNTFISVLSIYEPTENINPLNITWSEIFNKVDNIKVAPDIYSAVYDIKKKIGEDENAPFISDRRWRKSIKLLKAHAVLDGRDAVDDEDFEILVHALWDPGFPESRQAVEKAVQSVADPISLKLQELLNAAVDTANEALNASAEDEAAKGLEAMKGLKKALAEINNLSVYSTSSKAAKIATVRAKITELQKEVSAKCLGITL